ncbi:MAG: hypothetical protein L6Q54_04380 [Leptospiraceae bacterium]|nr:hypothetical protein [Leptospiraceae bacterium]MCK6380471.1 hypothetical protein [Leptospiraceae bacterium]
MNAKNIIILRSTVSVFVLYTILIFFIGSNFHSHKEENLHFHAEGILTVDHTVKVDNECKVCDILHSSLFFLINNPLKTYSDIFFKDSLSIGKINTQKSLRFLFLPGRDPPFAES